MRWKHAKFDSVFFQCTAQHGGHGGKHALDLNANYSCSSFRDLAGCHFWIRATSPPRPPPHSTPLFITIRRVFNSRACKSTSVGGVCRSGQVDVIFPMFCPAFIEKTNIYRGETGAVEGSWRLGGEKEDGDDLISTERVGSCEIIDNKYCKKKKI